MSEDLIKVGLVGAGANTALRHIPNLRLQQGVEIVGVANRSLESSRRVCKEFEISQAYSDWMEMMDDDEIDAICIGTWPYMHRTLTLAAMDAGKHVLCEARMASNATEAHEMLDASLGSPDLIGQIVPPPHVMGIERHLIDLISDNYLGEIIKVDASFYGQSTWPDYETPVHWRDDRDLSGNNVMQMGIWYENLMRLVGTASSVQARANNVAKWRPNANGERTFLTIPDQVDISYQLIGGGTVNFCMSTAIGPFAPPLNIWIYGDQGTIHITDKIPSDNSVSGGGQNNDLFVEGGQRSDDELKEITIPEGKRGSWRVEEEFINAIRGEEQVTRTNFTDGVKYMEFTDAVQESWQLGRAVTLPL